jgi:hypothetical protein
MKQQHCVEKQKAYGNAQANDHGINTQITVSDALIH